MGSIHTSQMVISGIRKISEHYYAATVEHIEIRYRDIYHS